MPPLLNHFANFTRKLLSEQEAAEDIVVRLLTSDQDNPLKEVVTEEILNRCLQQSPRALGGPESESRRKRNRGDGIRIVIELDSQQHDSFDAIASRRNDFEMNLMILSNPNSTPEMIASAQRYLTQMQQKMEERLQME